MKSAEEISSDKKDLLARLNDAQRSAVCLNWGPSLVIAGAGSGKTTVLTRRVAYLISELNQDPESIMAVTFTNKAAAEMKNRLIELAGHDVVKRLAIGTFHSICARLLRYEIELFDPQEGFKWSRNFVIYDEADSLSVLKGQIAKLNLDEKVFVAKEIKHAISSFKNDGHFVNQCAQAAKTYRETRLAEIYACYQRELASNNALDFDDLILITNELFRSNEEVLQRQIRRFRHLLVDEFQDTNQSQYQLISKLAPSAGANWDERSLMVVGDVDQSIYSWRKADFRIILGFQKDFKDCPLIKLEENYRSTETILEAANSIISNNSERLEKVLRPNRSKGAKLTCYEAADEIDEAYYVVEELKRLKIRGRLFSDCVLLYRTNAQSRAAEEVLVRNHIPYTVIGATRFYDRQEIKDILAYLKLIYNEQDSQSFNRVVNQPRRGLGKTTLTRLFDYCQLNGLSPLVAAQQAHEISDIPAKSAKSLQEFASLIRRWQMLSSTSTVSVLLTSVLKESGYLQKLEEDISSAKYELAIGRIENVRELIAVAREFEAIADEPDLASFLTRISLVSDLDALNLDQDAVKMMTLHSAKGLEFPVVFLMGLEEGLFPHIRSFDSPSALEEERRLMYVGVTRAADLLYLTLSRKRMMMGRFGSGAADSFATAYTIPSRFLKEITPGLLVGYYPTNETKPSAQGFERTRIEEDSPKVVDTNPRSQNRDQGGASIRTTADAERARHGLTTTSLGIAHGAASRFDKSYEADKLFEHLKVGDCVQHAKFGIGKVAQVIGENEKQLYNVEFESAGKRLLDPKFAKLIKIS